MCTSSSRSPCKNAFHTSNWCNGLSKFRVSERRMRNQIHFAHWSKGLLVVYAICLTNPFSTRCALYKEPSGLYLIVKIHMQLTIFFPSDNFMIPRSYSSQVSSFPHSWLLSKSPSLLLLGQFLELFVKITRWQMLEVVVRDSKYGIMNHSFSEMYRAI